MSKNLLGGALFTAIGIGALAAIPHQIPTGEPGMVGPRFVPTIMAVCILALSAILVVRELIAAGPRVSFRDILPTKEAWAVVGLIALWVGALLIGLGYLLSTIAFIFLCLGLFRVRALRNYVIGGAFAAALFALFAFALRVKLP